MRAGFWWRGAAGDPRGTFMVPPARACREEGTNWETCGLLGGGLFPLVE